MAEQGYLPGFEDMANDDCRRAQDKLLKKQLLKSVRAVYSLKEGYSSPFKLIEHENQIKAIMKAREDLWKGNTKC